MDVAQLVTAAAAVAAAALSLASFLRARHQDELKFRRESNVDTIVQFMDGSLKLPGNRAYEILSRGGDREMVVAAAFEGLEMSTSALTRLRILAPNELVAAVAAVHKLDDEITQRLLSGEPLPSVDEWLELSDRRRHARTAVLDAARLGIGLDPALEFEPTAYREMLERLRAEGQLQP